MARIKRNNIQYLLRTSLDLANEAIYLISYTGKIMFANGTACKSLGYSRKEIMQLYVWDIDVNNNKNLFFEKFNEFRKSKEVSTTIESEHIKKDKSKIQVKISSRVIDIDGKDHLLSYVSDNSQKIKQEEKLNLYFEFIKESSDMVFLVDYETYFIVFANEKVIQTLGYTKEELENTKISDLREAILESKPTFEVFKQIKKTKNLITYGKYKTKGGGFVYVETSLIFKNYQGKDYIMAISRDIGERLEIEKQKNELNEKLKNYNKTLQEEVSKIKKELLDYEDIMHRQSKMAAMGEMLENIAHQWRQPLSVISVLSTGMKLQNDTGTLDKESLKNGLNDINTNSQYLSKTIDDFSSFFKPNYNKSSFFISEILEYTLDLIRTKFKSYNIKLIQNINDLEIYTFKNELIQVIVNLLNNASDELIKNISLKEKIIFIDIYGDEKYIYIKVLDNAGGIDEKIRNRIFEPYFTTKHKSKGTGIGLYMSDEIVRKHMKGQIEVENRSFTYNETDFYGASFKIKLPIDNKI
ncbi:MAG: PAS domain-containing sensor histidine kinase [Campylobacterota bacterium]